MLLSGRVNLPALNRAYENIQMRHEALRTRYSSTLSGYRQFISDSVQPLSCRKLEGGTVEDQKMNLYHALKKDFVSAPNLSRTPLYLKRFQLVNGDQYLAGFVHHIAYDSVSHQLFWNEFFTSYYSNVLGLPTNLPRVLQPADHAIWEAEWLDENQRAENLAYWKKLLDKAESLRLPRGRANRDQASPQASAEIEIGGVSFAEIVECARKQEVTPAIVFFSIIALALGHWTGQTEVLIGLMVGGRPAAFRGTIGCFVQWRPLYIDLGGNPSFREIVALTKSAYIGATELRRPVPDCIAEKYKGRGALINLIPAREHQEAGRKLLGMSAKVDELPFRIKNEITRDLNFSINQTPSAFWGRIFYAADCFGPEEINQFIHNVMEISNYAAQPECRKEQILRKIRLIEPTLM
jgi:hypothetical protein